MKWIKDQKVEALLKRMGVKFETESIRYATIDLEEGLKRQARFVSKLNDDHVIQLGLGMMAPDAAFPMTVLNKPKSGAPWPWSGNHRLAAFGVTFPTEAHTAVIDCYTVSVSDPAMQDVLPRVLNSVESSIGFTKDERIAHARYLCEKHSYPVAEVAGWFNLKPEWIFIANRVEEVRTLIEPILNGKVPLSKSILLRMAPLAADANVLRETARVLTQYDVKGDDALHIINDVKAPNTSLQRLAELARWEKIHKQRKDPPAPKEKQPINMAAMRSRFFKIMTDFQKFLSKAKTLTQAQCADAQSEQVVRHLWKDIQKGMAEMLKEGGK